MTKLCITAPRPTCVTCDKLTNAVKHYYNDAGERIATSWRKYCGTCHNKRTAKKHGFTRISQISAKRAGLTETQYQNQFHPYLRHRKSYCENQDGRLGFTCNTVLPTPEMLTAAGLQWLPEQFLEVDHIDGNPKNNDPENLQTLCKHCHTIKGIQNGDHLTPGRKTLMNG